MPSLGRTYLLIVYEFPTPNLGTVLRLSIEFKWGTLIPHLSVLRLTSALGFGVYSLTWKTYILIVHEFPVPRLGTVLRLSIEFKWGTLIPHLSVLRLTSALGFGVYSLTWKTYILIVHEFPVPRLGPIPRLSVRLGEEHYSLIRLSSARPLSLTSRLINRATLSPFLTWTKKSLELYI